MWPEGHREPRSEVGSRTLAESISKIWISNLPILSWRAIPLPNYFQPASPTNSALADSGKKGGEESAKMWISWELKENFR